MIFAGVDIGSTTTKACIVSEKRRLGGAVLQTAPSPSESARRALALALKMASAEPGDLQGILATGYGRKTFTPANGTISEITAQAKGVGALFPQARSILDIGGQDSKVIALDPKHRITDFVMNDKCAAGTGRFLEFTLHSLGLDFQALKDIEEANPYPLNTTCAVFAQSEVVSLLAGEVPIGSIVAGLFWQMATKAKNLASRLRISFPLVFTGGMAKLNHARKALLRSFQEEILFPEEPQLTAALGAALLAEERAESFSVKPPASLNGFSPENGMERDLVLRSIHP